MTHQERNYMLSFIKNAFNYVVFQHEQERLEMLMAKYCDPQTQISEDEQREDLLWLEQVFETI